MKRRNERIYEMIQKIRKKMSFLYAKEIFAKLLKITSFSKIVLTAQSSLTARLTFTCSKSPIGTLEIGLKYVQI